MYISSIEKYISAMGKIICTAQGIHKIILGGGKNISFYTGVQCTCVCVWVLTSKQHAIVNQSMSV